MKFGLAVAGVVGTDPKSAMEFCTRGEAAGFESVWRGEHVVMPAKIESKYPMSRDGKFPEALDMPFPDPLMWLAYVSAAAPSLKLCTSIIILAQHNPLVLAKSLASLDYLSGGKVELGIGVGWCREEFEALGIPWERRGARTDEYVAAMRALWAKPEAEFHGEFVDFDPVYCSPRPAKGKIPIIIGGESPAALRRVAKLGDGFVPGAQDPQELKRMIDIVHEQLKEYDRKPEEVEVTAAFIKHMSDPLASVEKLREVGVSRVIVPTAFFDGPGGFDRMAEFGEKVIKSSQG